MIERPSFIFRPTPVLYEAFILAPQPPMNYFISLDALKNQYCFCSSAEDSEQKPLKNWNESSTKSIPLIQIEKKIKKKNKMLYKPYIIEKAESTLKRLLDISDKDALIFKRTNKWALTPGHQPVKQRSTFIGVSKNGNHWQSLIVINNTKVYMGTYKTQQEAATVFDFHSMVVHFKCAKVNYDYSANDLIRMIQNFKQNSNEFDANEYLSSIH